MSNKNCPFFRRIIARILDTIFCVTLTLLISIIILISRVGIDNLSSATLKNDEMLIISFTAFIIFNLYFVVLPIFNKGRTVWKYLFNIYMKTSTKKLWLAIIIRELFTITFPMFITLFLPLAFSESAYSSLFVGRFIDNWNNSNESIPFRALYLICSGLYLVSIIYLFINNKGKTIFDLFANTWLYIVVKEDKKIEQTRIKPKKDQKRPGEIDFEKIENND